ncbi:macrophage colony-stimulating factor 1-like [Anolis sagrei]|uniref:macrophage colony-stimulating factor 1-like n=1 Tax=Anolis sagrei TaxID=38937 RepID=UPI003520864C
MISQIHMALILLIAYNIHKTELNRESCQRLIVESHLRNLSDMIDSQMETSCKRTVIYVDRSELTCTKEFSLTPEKMLQKVHEYFSEAQHFLSKPVFTHDCSSAFKKCSDSQEKKRMLQILARRQPQRNDNNMERPEEGRPLNRGEEHIELHIQEEL